METPAPGRDLVGLGQPDAAIIPILMNSATSETILRRPTAAIDGADRTFAVTPVWISTARLVASIAQAGVVSPLRLQRRADGGLRIVSGFRRFQASRTLGLESVPCVEVPASASEKELFLSALHENLGSRILSDVERAFALVKLRDLCGLGEKELIERFLPLLGLRPDRFHLRQYVKLASLPDDLQRALPDLNFDLAFRLAAWDAAERAVFLELLERFRLGRNRQREIFELLDELRAIERTADPAADLLKLWRRSGAADLTADPSQPAPSQLQRILECLRRMRFPTLSSQEDRFQQLKAALKIPPQVQFNAPRFFEGDRITIQFAARAPEELGRLASRLEDISRRPELAKIFEML